MNKLENVLDESLLHTASGDRKALRLLLKKVIPDRFHYYHESRAITRQEEYADLLYKILLLELDEEEEESISLTWASASASCLPRHTSTSVSKSVSS